MRAATALAIVCVSLLAAGAAFASGGRVPVEISLQLGDAVGLFEGKVKSEASTCTQGRKVRIVRISGQDIRVGKGFTDSKGRYSIQTTESSGDWIAKVKHETVGEVVCKGAQSKIRSAG